MLDTIIIMTAVVAVVLIVKRAARNQDVLSGRFFEHSNREGLDPEQ
jgi:hypothetical protein